MPELLDALMQNAYETIIESYENKNEIEIIRLQLLFVRKAIGLLHIGDMKSYIIFFDQISSCRVEREKYVNFFRKK